MTNRLFYSAICAIAVCVAVSCGGKQGKSSSGDSASEKGLFGEVMALVHEYQEENDKIGDKISAAAESQNMSKMEKLMEEQKELKPEFEEKLAAISQKISGTSIAYEVPDSFFFQMSKEPVVTKVEPNGLNANAVIRFTVSAKSDFTVGKYKRDEYRVFMKSVDEAGNAVGYHAAQTIEDDRKPQEIKAGQELSPITVNITLAEEVNKEAAMAKIVFITESEWLEGIKRK